MKERPEHEPPDTTVRDEQGNLLPDAEWLKRLGRFLRSTSLDELRMGLRRRERVEQEFTPRAAARKYAELLER